MQDDKKVLEYLESGMDLFLARLKTFVELETPSHQSKAASDKCAEFLYGLMGELGFEMEYIPQESCGDHVYGEYGTGEKGVLFVGHYDTVFPLGTLETMPYKVAEGKAYGPGILDMKSGILMAHYAVKALIDLQLMPDVKIGVFFNSDEESGSFRSSDLIVEKAKKYKYVFVMEPGGDAANIIKKGRFGRGTYQVAAAGVSAHSGSNPHLAKSPIHELAHQLVKIEEINRNIDGATLTPTWISGGIPGTCRVPEEAAFSMDVRFKSEETGRKLHEEILSLQPHIDGVKLNITGEIDKPVMYTEESLFQKAVEAAKIFGTELEGITVGGGSDGNFTSHAGIPTLDGMGGSGDLLHNPGEYIHIDHIPRRTALVAKLIRELK